MPSVPRGNVRDRKPLNCRVLEQSAAKSYRFRYAFDDVRIGFQQYKRALLHPRRHKSAARI